MHADHMCMCSYFLKSGFNGLFSLMPFLCNDLGADPLSFSLCPQNTSSLEDKDILENNVVVNFAQQKIQHPEKATSIWRFGR